MHDHCAIGAISSAYESDSHDELKSIKTCNPFENNFFVKTNEKNTFVNFYKFLFPHRFCFYLKTVFVSYLLIVEFGLQTMENKNRTDKVFQSQV